MADRISLEPGNESTLNLRSGSDSGSAGMLGGGIMRKPLKYSQPG